MRLQLLLSVLSCLSFVTSAGAWEPVQLQTAQLTVPRTEPGTLSHTFGLRVAFPIPSHDVSDSDLGLTAAFDWTALSHPSFGVGVDFGYHYWTVSSEFKESFNEYLRYYTFGFIELGGESWRLEAWHAGVHATAIAPVGGWTSLQLDLGIGAYEVDPNIEGFQADEGVWSISAPGWKPFWVVGFNGRADVDLVRRENLSFGLGVSYDHLVTTEELGSDFHAWAGGLRVRFGR